MFRFLALAVAAVGLLAAAVTSAKERSRVADLVFTGGDIVTLDDARPTAEALAVADGRILAVGRQHEVMKLVGEKTRVVELAGATLVPGFVDGHSHLFMVGVQAIAANLLPPPDAVVTDLGVLQDRLREWGRTEASQQLGWIIGFGYDDAQLAEHRHPTRDDLDAVSRDVPVLAIHQSGHLGAVNSKALELAGITAETTDPDGGVIRRRAGGREPNGVLEELAFWQVLGALPTLGPEHAQAILREGQKTYARYGYTTAQEGRASPGVLRALGDAATSGQLMLDVVAYPDVAYAEQAMRSEWVGAEYRGRLRIGGVKLSLDGSPQAKTAWLTRPYYVPPEGRPATYRGYPALSDEAVFGAVELAFANGWQVLAHCNGDAAADQFIAAVRAAERRHGRADRRPVMIHAQTVREDQLDAMQQLGILPSFFAMHTYYWGDWHRENVLGPERADRISPTRSALRRGLTFSSHHDAPVALPDSMRVLSATVSRRTRSGDILGPEQRVTPLEGLKSLTIWGARQYFEEHRKGSLEVGKLADLVVLSANPLETDPEQLASIRVMETIKEGRTIYRGE